MRWLLKAMFLTVALSQSATLYAQDDGSKDILSENASIRSEAAKRIVNDRRVLITALLQIVENQDAAMESRITAIDLLGTMRAEEATEVLLRNLLIGERPSGGATEVADVSDLLPAARALISIGMESVRAILSQRNAYLNGEVDKKTLKIYAYIIEKVLTPPMAKSVLRDLAERETGPARKRNIDNMLKIRKLLPEQ